MSKTRPLRLDKQEKLLELSRLLSQASELEPFLQRIAEAACELTNSETSSLFLYEAETGLLKFVAAPRDSSEKLRLIRVPLEHSVAGEAYTQVHPVIVQDASRDTRIFRSVDQELDFITRSILAVPLIYRSEVLGALEAVNKRGGANYTEEDVTILETLATYAATYIFNTVLFEEAHQAYQALDEMEKKKSDFIAIASHELRTPLGLIMGHATYLRDMAGLDEQLSKQMDVIVRSAIRLKDLVDDMANVDLGQSSRRHMPRKQIHLHRLVFEVVRSFQEFAKQQQVKLRLEVTRDEMVIYGDEEKLAIALGNLLKNALIFTDTQGQVLVRVEKLPGYVKISVIDSGVGIPAKDLPHVFERFYQVESHLSRRHGGMGLGLSVAKVMVEMHGGQIWAESIENKGSNFSFLLPLGDEQGESEKKVFQE